MNRLRWGILSTGAIAHRFATELRDSRSGELVAVGSRNAETAQAFAKKFGITRAHGHSSYVGLLGDDEVDAVYIATPHPGHAEWAIRAAEAGKHVLCEKPLTINHTDAAVVIDAARRHGVFLMEAFMYRCHPQTQRLVELVRDGAIGDLRVIEAVHSYRIPHDPSSRLLDPGLGGGGILDVGCYCMSAARLFAGEEPATVTGAAHVGVTGVDEWAVASVGFPNEVIAHLATGVRVDQAPALRLHGSTGRLEVTMPWLPGIDGSRKHAITLSRTGRKPERMTVKSDRGLYAYEADEVAACIGRNAVESEATTWADTLGNMAALDRWREAVGQRYPAERPGDHAGLNPET